MSASLAIAILLLLFLGPIVLAPVERNLEAYFFAIGLLAATVAGVWTPKLIISALRAPLLVTAAVVISGIAFGRLRGKIDNGFAALRRRISRPILTASTVFVIALLSSVITAIVAAIVLVEAIGMLRLGPPARSNVAIVGCFGIGLGSALTPAGGPLSALVATALNLPAFRLLQMLGPWVLPTTAFLSLLAGFFAHGDYDLIAEDASVHESIKDALLQGVRIFIFVAGLVLVSQVLEPFARRWLPSLSQPALFWSNTSSAALDNSTLVALEARGVGIRGLPWIMPSLLISGGMLIPGNIPNIVCAGMLEIRSLEWALLGVPLGLTMLGIAFALLRMS